MAWLALSVGLIAWWLLPLLLHYSPYAASLVRATPAQVVSWFPASYVEWLWLAALMALMLLASKQPRVEATVGALALLVPLVVGGILVNDRVLVARLGITLLDPIRFIAEYYLALILLVGCAVGAVTSRLLWRIPWLACICLVVVAITLRPVLPEAWQNLRTRVEVAPSSIRAGIFQHPAFHGYWEALRNDPTTGRIFFVNSYLRLTDESGIVTPTTINSMTPYLIGREIIGGTFSHWSPIARWLWVGDPRAELLPAQVEIGDGEQVFGQPWDQIAEDELVANLNRLNVTTLVAEVNDQKAIARLDSSPHFARFWQNDYFLLYHLVDSQGDWLEAQGAKATLVERTPLRWRIEIAESAPSATLLLKMSEYPLWRAEVDGQLLPIKANADGLQEITLPPGGPYTLEVSYRQGWPEWSALLLSIGSLILIALLLYLHMLGVRRRLVSDA
jgi:hypothetical protein